MVNGIVIPCDPLLPLKARTFTGLADYQRAVDGPIEPVDLPDEHLTVIVNEVGLLRGLPLNPRATLLWWLMNQGARNRAGLAGDAIIVGEPDHAGESTDVPGEYARLLLRTAGYRVEVRVVDHPDDWYGNDVEFDDYFVAIASGLGLLECWTAAQDIRVRPILTTSSAPTPA